MFPVPADRVWALMVQPATMLYVLRGLFGFPALSRRRGPVTEGETGDGRLRLFHLVPFGRWSIRVVRVDPGSRTIATEEHGGIFRRWAHTLHVEPVGEHSCRYSDLIEIDAGPLTRLAAPVVNAIFAYRHRRWNRLLAERATTGG